MSRFGRTVSYLASHGCVAVPWNVSFAGTHYQGLPVMPHYGQADITIANTYHYPVHLRSLPS